MENHFFSSFYSPFVQFPQIGDKKILSKKKEHVRILPSGEKTPLF